MGSLSVVPGTDFNYSGLIRWIIETNRPVSIPQRRLSIDAWFRSSKLVRTRRFHARNANTKFEGVSKSDLLLVQAIWGDMEVPSDPFRSWLRSVIAETPANTVPIRL